MANPNDTAWRILKVLPCGEMRVRQSLHDMGLDAYVPVEISSRSYGRGGGAVRVSPLIRGYVFARFGLGALHRVSAIREVQGAMLVNDRPASLSQVQVDAIEMLSKPLQQPRRKKGFEPGDRVRIRRGAWAEFRGVVAEIERGRVVTLLTMFGREMRVPLAPEMVEAA